MTGTKNAAQSGKTHERHGKKVEAKCFSLSIAQGRRKAMYMATGDPVTDAERYQQYLDETYPEKEGAVRMTLDVWVNVQGCTEGELREAAFQIIKELMQDKRVSEWDYEFEEVEFDEYS